MRKLLMLVLGVFVLCAQLLAQNRTVTGRITDDKGTGVPNASVTIKGGRTGTTTNAEGEFSLSVPPNAKALIVSSIGLGEKEISLTTSDTYTVSLSSQTRDLQEVVVVGYGTQKKANITGSVAAVKAADIENKPFTSVDKALQGQVPGLLSVASSGAPGSNQAIRIRGVSSINAGNNPLWVIDGVPVNTGDASRLATTSNMLSTLNPNDIESITVLKDAAAASIYGSRASNGVIVVTTKSGRAGKTKFRFDTEVGQSDIAYENSRFRPLNASDYFDITREGLVNAGYSNTVVENTLTGLGMNNGVDFNWYDAVKRKGSQQQYNLSASGGTDKTTFYLSSGLFKQQGAVINSQLERYNGAIRVQNKATDKLTLGANLTGGYVNSRAPLNGGAFGNPVLTSYFILPSRNPYNDDGSYKLTNSFGGLHNTIALTDLDKRELKEFSLRGSVSGEYKILDNLSFKTNFGADYNTLEEDQYNNPLHGDGQSSNGRAFAYYTRYSNYVWTNTANYNQELNRTGDINLGLQAGYEYQISKGYFSSLQSQNFPFNLSMQYPTVGASPITASASTSDYAISSAFSSANLNLWDRFILSGSFRRDGHSRFGANNKFGNFWSVGASWNVDKENFMQGIDVVSQLKLRTSYGVNGNAGIGNYEWQKLYSYGSNYDKNPGSAPNNIGDSSLTWELNKPFNVGIDLGVLNNRISLSVDYYDRKSEDLLLSFPLSRTSGFSTVTRNYGALENKGVEIGLNAIPVRSKDLLWNVNFNFAHNKNKVTKLPSDIANGTQLIRLGYDVQTFYLREYAGVDSDNGDPLWWADAEHSKTTNVYSSATRQMLGSAAPKYFGALTNTLNFKGFSLEAQLYYNFGNYVYDTWGSYYTGAGFGGSYNKVNRIMERWQQPGDVTDMPKYIYGGNKSFQSSSTFYLTKGDFIRLRNIQLGYDLPKSVLSKINVSALSFYVRGTNLYTWVKDDNMPFDPEQGSTSSTNLEVFIPKTLTVGLNLGF